MENKKDEIIKEVLDEINSALKDPRGLKTHQRRLAFSLSLGCVNLIEEYLIKKDVLKSGAKINHLWFKKKPENVKKLISNQIVCPVENISNLDNLLKIVYEIEKERNELAYGKIVSEGFLGEQINLFLDLKKEVEK
ncbi:MAG: hypothetical protein AABY06_02900 [Nanoarchaeota archaeon]